MSSYVKTNLTDYTVTTKSCGPFTDITTTSIPFNQPQTDSDYLTTYVYTEHENGWNWCLSTPEEVIKEAVRNALKEENTLVVPKIEKYRIKHR